MILFFVRHFNDIDHLTPVVWKLNVEGRAAAVFCMNLRYGLQADYRLRFLRDQGVRVDYLPHARGARGGRIHDILQAGVRRAAAIAARREADSGAPAGRAARWRAALADLAASLGAGWMRRRYYRTAWARRLLAQTGADCLCFDYVMPGLYAVAPLMAAAREKAIPVLALPHGVHLFTNDQTKPKATEERRLAKFNRFDAVVVPNRLRREILARAGVAPERLAVLGSARYCPEWLEQNRRIAPRRLEPGAHDPARLKAVFMMSKPQVSIDAPRLATTLTVLAEAAAAGIAVKIKPHTRTSDRLAADPRLDNAAHILSTELCEWADVVLVVGSSVVTEALMAGKTVLYLKYLHPNTTRFEELGACWTIGSEPDLRRALAALDRERSRKPYGPQGVERFLWETVYGESAERDVLRRYTQFIRARIAARRRDEGSPRA
jgi:hypothetical protein